MMVKYFWRAAMAPEVSREITGLLRAWGAGDAGALERLIPRIYNDLRRAARHEPGLMEDR